VAPFADLPAKAWKLITIREDQVRQTLHSGVRPPVVGRSLNPYGNRQYPVRRKGLIRFTGLGGTTPYVLARLCVTGQFDGRIAAIRVLTAFNYSGGSPRSDCSGGKPPSPSSPKP
jgi:hypothetical protein